MGAHFLTTRCNADKQQDGAGAIPGYYAIHFTRSNSICIHSVTVNYRYTTGNSRLLTRTGENVFSIFCFQKLFRITKLVPQCFMLPIEHYW